MREKRSPSRKCSGTRVGQHQLLTSQSVRRTHPDVTINFRLISCAPSRSLEPANMNATEMIASRKDVIAEGQA